MRIVATVVAGVKRKMTTESVVTARTNVVTKPTRREPASIGRMTSQKPRSRDAPGPVAALHEPPGEEREDRRDERRDAAEDQRVAERVTVGPCRDEGEVLRGE